MSAIVLNGEIVHYEVLGRGRPLVFLHGWVGSWRYWIPNMQAASTCCRAYALDLWGFGDTAKNPHYYSLLQQIELLNLFLRELGIGKITLVGHGLGAVVALLFATHNPGQLERLMLVGLPSGKRPLNTRLVNASPAELAAWLPGRTALAAVARAETPKVDRRAISHSLAGLQHVDLANLPYILDTPSLLVHGQNDPLVDGWYQEQFVSLPEHIHQIVFEQSGHFPMLDEPSKFNRLLGDFLALASGASPRQLQLKEEWKRRVR
jgi:pimeloyl-ACP methyl ester carboxylesterase